MKLEYKENDIQIKINTKTVNLPAPIWEVFEYKNRALVVLDPQFGMRNVFCYDEQGALVWTISRADFFKVDGNGYEAIGVGDLGDMKDRLIASCRGRPFFLDFETGRVELVPGVSERM